VTEGIFAVLYVSIMGLTRCYKTTFFTLMLLYSPEMQNSTVVCTSKTTF